jgi:chromosome segregation ATPase
VRDRSPSTSSSDDDEELPDAEEDESSELPTSTQYELIRDGGFKHLEHSELDDQRATQRFLKRRQQIGENHAMDNAIIQEITCMNFMCHERLHVALGPLINFVVGHNGSGKSAVLTAITLCLGGKAASTNRGASLKSLIKEGRDSAALIIKLKNQGIDAYQPDVYGDSIIIERHFSRTGSSGFKVKSANGRLISSKKGDVEDIVEYYQLQVDNPMNVLTQDAAKSFITASTPAQKFKFFVEGVQLEALDNDYRIVSDTCDQIEDQLEESKEDISALRRKAEAARRKAEIVLQHEGMRRRYRELGNKCAWAQVQEQEESLARRENRVAEAQHEIERAEAEVENRDQQFQQTERVLERSRDTEKTLEEELIPLREAEEAAKIAHSAASLAAQNAHSESIRIKDSLVSDKKKIKVIEKRINTEVKRIEDANGGAQSRKLVEIEDAKQAASDAKAALGQNDEDRPRLEERRRTAQEELKRIERACYAKQKETEDARQRLQTMNQNRGNSMAGFDRQMPKLLQMIRSDSGFREKPVGPLGLHIKLLNPLWSNVLESTIGTMLSGFIVTSKFDQMRLSNMLQQLKMGYCPVAIGKDLPIDTSAQEPDPQVSA